MESATNGLDWRFILAVGIPALAVVLGWFFSHWLTTKRELASRKREARLKALEIAYMRLSKANNRPPTERLNREIETFVSEIQLYGTPTQIGIMKMLVESFKNGKGFVSFDAILSDLRDTIRKELKLETVEGDVWWLRLRMLQKTDSPQDSDAHQKSP